MPGTGCRVTERLGWASLMSDLREISGPPLWWRRMLWDIQFWIPLAVLVGGLLLLRWVA